MSTINYSASNKGKRRDRLRAAVAGLTLAGLVMSAGSATLMMTTTPAYAANLAHGHGFNNPSYEYILGSWRTVDGKLAYCIQFGVPTPNTNQVNVGDKNFVIDNEGKRIEGIKVAQMNYVLKKWGQTEDDLTSAAVAWAVWFLSDQVDETGIGYNPVTGQDASIFTFAGNQAQLHRAELTALFNTMTQEAIANATLNPGNPSSLTMQGAMEGDTLKGAVTAPAGYTDLKLTNGKFDSNGTNNLKPNGQPGAYPWTGVIPDSATTSYKVDVTGTWAVEQNDYVEYWETQDGQDLINQPVDPPKRTGQSLGSVSADIGMTPQLVSKVPSKRVEGNGSGKVTLQDSITLSLNGAAAAPYNSTNLRKFEDGKFAQFNLDYTVYGPLKSMPKTTADVPAGAPVAASGSLTTSDVDGFSKPYNTSVEVDDKAGFYTFVWGIDAAKQSDKVKPLIPANYKFTDAYGLDDETSHVPTKLRFKTALTSNKGPADSVAIDKVTTSVDGHWLENEDGVPYTAELVGTVYRHGKGDFKQQPNVPSDATAVKTLKMNVSAPDVTYDSEEIKFAGPGGMYTIQWCVPASEYFEAWCDDYGVPSESFEVVAPKVTTVAQAGAKFGDSVIDTAKVVGNVPDNTKLRFTAFREVIAGDPKFDSKGDIIKDSAWTQAEIDAMSVEERCEIQPIGTTDFVDVPAEGEYKSPAIKTVAAGSNHRMFWVEELLTVDPVTKEENLLAKGRCGEKTEISYISWPTITTDAGGDIQVGKSRGDRTFVTNANADIEYSVTHDLYLAKKDDKAPTCDVERRVFSTEDAPVKLKGSTEYEFTSAEYKYKKAGQYYWVEKLIHDGKVVAEGKCGEPAESVKASIVPPQPNEIPGDPLTTTSTPVSSGLMWGGILLLLAGGVTAVVARRVA